MKGEKFQHDKGLLACRDPRGSSHLMGTWSRFFFFFSPQAASDAWKSPDRANQPALFSLSGKRISKLLPVRSWKGGGRTM